MSDYEQNPLVVEAKSYLEQIRRLDAIINGKIAEAEKLQSTIYNCTSVLSDEPSSPYNPHSKSDAVVRLMDLREEINADIDEFVEMKKVIPEIIYCLPNPLHIKVLTRRYLDFKKWEEIAVECHIDYRWVHRVHNRALEAVGEKLSEIRH